MYWPEKILILVVLALVVALLALSYSFVPVLDHAALVGPVLIPPCGFRMSTGIACPTCFMTRSFALMARGQVAQALLAQPIGAAGFVACVLLLPVAIGAAVTGKDALRHFTGLLWNARLSWVIVGMLGAAWVFKIALTLMRR